MKPRDLLPLLALVAALAIVPAFASNSFLNFLVTALIVAIAAQGWNLLGGFGGQFSFGHAAFFGTGAYVTAVLQIRLGVNAWLAAGLGVLAGAAIGGVIGLLVFRARLRGSYFALVTLAFAEVLRILANAADITGGAAGLLVRLAPDPWNFQFQDRASFAWIAVACVGAALLLGRVLERGRFGAQLVAVRENEDAARALGVDVLATKLKAIVLSAGMTACAGCLYVQYFLYLDANIAYGAWISVEALLAAIVGGVGTVTGPVIGALALHALAELTKGIAVSVNGADLVLFGLLLVLTIAFAPAGIVGSVRRLRSWRRSAQGRPAGEA
ncbi:Branched-chain amino acid ABC transporter permease [Rhodovastum atsumiense]|uniref:Branched-chain amino acid ABC transporter permease n=1 Tax=Rhodovastum atsumiense TaxID=504468 RepID=A0A5M6IUI9_9PROT|nr:branched-chain amino acid ABC transporter permease [Rhodovastum atsumiense]KAA5611946.1 branched-chain amino acid ABC transporter permease [Rhodovastum atsumiense]CAH2598712.1 Branched-chain amino acid ABC transporter permease [Rhodovastum atsumiense]